MGTYNIMEMNSAFRVQHFIANLDQSSRTQSISWNLPPELASELDQGPDCHLVLNSCTLGHKQTCCPSPKSQRDPRRPGHFTGCFCNFTVLPVCLLQQRQHLNCCNTELLILMPQISVGAVSGF